MLSWLLFGKREVRRAREDAKQGFDSVKSDINSLSEWVKHLNTHKEASKKNVSEIDLRLSSMEKEIENLKNFLMFGNNGKKQTAFKTSTGVQDKQTLVQGVDKVVQTAVQTGVLRLLTSSERALVYVLLNSDLKLSYEDLSAMLGKSRATIRGQINSIKQKSDGVLEEVMEKNGKKRVYIPEEIKEELLKTEKVRSGRSEEEKSGKNLKNRESEGLQEDL
ncbi:MAG: hypothetical protein KKF56_01180 [Nanoarchaeota archaeon]|nr:hypothetical protein [Nanoarchaeota archaeon]